MRPNFAIDQSTTDFPAPCVQADPLNAISSSPNATKPRLPAGLIAGKQMTRPANQTAIRPNRSYFRPTPLELKALGFFFRIMASK